MAGDETYRFFVDANCLGIAKILADLRGDVLFPGHPAIPEVPEDCDDTEWMPVVAARNLVVIGRDKKISTKPAELEAYRDLGIRAFWIAGDKTTSRWDCLHRVVRWWERIEDLIAAEGKGPWFYALYPTGVNKINLREGHRPRPAVIAPRRAPIVGKDNQLLLGLKASTKRPAAKPKAWDRD
jgi:hypothetical protein